MNTAVWLLKLLSFLFIYQNYSILGHLQGREVYSWPTAVEAENPKDRGLVGQHDTQGFLVPFSASRRPKWNEAAEICQKQKNSLLRTNPFALKKYINPVYWPNHLYLNLKFV